MTEEIVNPTPETQPVEEAKPAEEANKVNNNYEVLVQQQQQQIEQLIKQQELTNKVNQQLSTQMNKVLKGESSSATEHWVDKVLEEFQFDAKYDPVKEQNLYLAHNNKQVALWWLQYYKDKGLSNDEIATKYKKMMQVLETGAYPSN